MYHHKHVILELSKVVIFGIEATGRGGPLMLVSAGTEAAQLAVVGVELAPMQLTTA